MASTYKYPEDYISWFVVGDRLAIVTTKTTTSTAPHRTAGSYLPIDESVTNGILIHYNSEPNKISAITDSISDIDNTLVLAIEDYIKSKMFMERAGQTADMNIGQAAMALAREHERKWKEKMDKWQQFKTSKIGGIRAIRPFDFR